MTQPPTSEINEELKQLIADFNSLEKQARRKERDAHVEAETYFEAAMKVQNVLYVIESKKSP